MNNDNNAVELHLDTLVSKINEAHAQVRGALRKGLDHAIDCGNYLHAAKKRVGHGNWLKWLEENCPNISERLAQRYMQVAHNMPQIDTSNPTRVSDLSLRGVLDLISFSTKTMAKLGIDDAENAIDPEKPLADKLKELKGRQDRDKRAFEKRAKKARYYAQRDAADTQRREEEYGPEPDRGAKDENQWNLYGFDEAELAGALAELERMGLYLNDMVTRTKQCYEYAVSWAAKRAAEEVWRLRERLTYDRDQLQHAVYGLRELLKEGPLPGKEVRRWARNAHVSTGLLALASKILGVVQWSTPERGGRDMWSLDGRGSPLDS